jgi:hypothetical protein
MAGEPIQLMGLLWHWFPLAEPFDNISPPPTQRFPVNPY